MYKYKTRRDFFKLSGVVISSLFIPIELLSANENSDNTIIALKGTFTNGDPFSIKKSLDTTKLNGNIAVKYELSLDDSFDTIVHKGENQVNQKSNLNINIDTENLNSNIKYHYRLSAYDEGSAYWFNKTGKIRFI